MKLVLSIMLMLLLSACGSGSGNLNNGNEVTGKKSQSTQISGVDEFPDAKDAVTKLTGIPAVAVKPSDLPKGSGTSPAAISAKAELSLAFVGDILLGGTVGEVLKSGKVEDYLSEAALELGAADIAGANLENPLSNRGKAEADKQYTFRAPPSRVEVLKYLGMDYLTLGNNHILDFGNDAFLDTIYTLGKANLVYTGAGKDEERAHGSKIMVQKKMKVAFVSASNVLPNVNWYAGKDKIGVAGIYDPAKTIEEIKKVRSKADLVVAYIHWGNEKEGAQNNKQTDLAHKLVDSGCDLVIGSHPHVLQGVEFYKGKLIAYSMGNFIFTDGRKDTMIFKVEVGSGKVLKATISPYRIINYFPKPMVEEKERKEFFQNIQKVSPTVIIDESGNIKQK